MSQQEEVHEWSINVEVMELAIENASLSDVESGILKQVIAQGGPGRLSPKQLAIYQRLQRNVLSATCGRCGEEMPTSEVPFSWDNGGLCSWCQKMSDNDD